MTSILHGVRWKKWLPPRENLQLLLERKVTGVRLNKGRVVSVMLENGEKLSAYRFIDATQDAWAAYMAGAGFTLGMDDIGLDKRQAVTLIIEVGGVNWEKVVGALTSGEYAGGAYVLCLGIFGGDERANRLIRRYAAVAQTWGCKTMETS